MTSLSFLLIGVLLTLMLLAVHARTMTFRAQAPADYAGKEPRFDLRRHLNGPILCEGVIYGPTGRVSSRFVADFDARWDGNVGVMTERFHYDSGAVQDREWTLTLGNDGSHQGHRARCGGRWRGPGRGRRRCS